MSFNPLAVFTCIALPLFALSLSACRWPWNTDTDPTLITLAGTLETREADLAFRVPGRIERLAVDEGYPVAAGQVIATLEARDYELALQSAKAQAEAARAALAALQAGSREQEVRVAEADLVSAAADLKFASSELTRVSNLAPRHLATQEQLDQARLQRDTTGARVEKARQNLALLREGPRKEDIERAAADYQARQVAVAVAGQQLGYIELQSPSDGVVSVRLAERGEVVAAGQGVLRVAELSRPWVRAYLNETDLPRVKLGQPAEVRVDGLAQQVFQGRLSFISPQAEFTPKTVETRALRVDLVYRIKVDVDNRAGLLKLGMPADVILKVMAAP